MLKRPGIQGIALCLPIVLLSCHPRDRAGTPIAEISIGTPAKKDRLLRGFYQGTAQWGWTGRTFAVLLDVPPRDEKTYVELDFTVPEELVRVTGPVVLTAKVNGIEAGKQRYDAVGRYVFSRLVPVQALERSPAEVQFELDKSAPDSGLGHETAVIAVSAALKQYTESAGFREERAQAARAGYAKVIQERNLRIPVEKQNEMMRLFHELPVWENTWFHNVRIVKNPLDLWMMQQIIAEVRPDFVVETGTWKGGSALYWASVLHSLGLESSRVLTVDLQDLTHDGARADFLWKKYVDFYRGSSTDAEVVNSIASRVKGRKVIVTLDSDHAMPHVLKELRLYAPMVSHGSYLVVEDTHLDGLPTHPEIGPGPMAAVRTFLSENTDKDFEQDLSREAMLMTFNPGGWLHRK